MIRADYIACLEVFLVTHKLGIMSHVGAHFNPFRHSVNFGTRSGRGPTTFVPKVDSSFILQYSPSLAGSVIPQILWKYRSTTFILFNCTCQDSNSRLLTSSTDTIFSVELHTPTSSNQKCELLGKGGQFTYISALHALIKVNPINLG